MGRGVDGMSLRGPDEVPGLSPDELDRQRVDRRAVEAGRRRVVLEVRREEVVHLVVAAAHLVRLDAEHLLDVLGVRDRLEARVVRAALARVVREEVVARVLVEIRHDLVQALDAGDRKVRVRVLLEVEHAHLLALVLLGQERDDLVLVLDERPLEERGVAAGVENLVERLALLQRIHGQPVGNVRQFDLTRRQRVHARLHVRVVHPQRHGIERLGQHHAHEHDAHGRLLRGRHLGRDGSPTR